MRARVFDPVREAPERAFGSILAADVHGSGDHATLRKGMRFSDADRSTLAALPGPVHLVDLEPDELEQDAVARRLALAAAGPGTRADEPAQGQARIRAAARGLLRVRADAVEAVNRLHPLLLFTAGDGAVVAEGDDVAGAKSASLATREQLVAEAEHLGGEPCAREEACLDVGGVEPELEPERAHRPPLARARLRAEDRRG
ncbi:MAG: hypothetical protein AAB295_10885, partial [Chloroflexota bacterium]